MKVTQSTIQFLFTCVICFVLSCKDNPLDSDAPFEAGPILFVSDKSGTWQLWSMNEDGSNVRQLTHDPNFPISDARWSPDGLKIVFRSRDDRLLSPRDRGVALYVMNADGTGRYKLTNPPLEAFHYPVDTGPVWSPDGKRIAFSRLMPPEISGDDDIFIIDVNGKSERRITSNRNLVERPAGWLPGEKLLIEYFDYSRRDSIGQGDGTGQIAEIDMHGNYIRTLSPYEEDDSSPILSPDNSQIAFSSLTTRNGSKGRFLHLMASDGSSRRRLSISSRQYERPVEWSPNGQRILCMTQDPNKRSDPNDPYSNFPQDILIVNVADGSVRTITPFPHREAYSTATSWRRR
jgi:Tol biopolymer transport system component